MGRTKPPYAPEFRAEAARLAKTSGQPLRATAEHLGVSVEAWLQAAAASELAPFTRLAAGLLGDGDAVRNAFLYPWSTGPVEGHITRIKLLKRQGYGRAKMPLLRARVLGAT